MLSRIIADDPTRESVYVEIYCNNEMIAEVTHENGRNELTIFNHPSQLWRKVPLADFIAMLDCANKDMMFLKDDKEG